MPPIKRNLAPIDRSRQQLKTVMGDGKGLAGKLDPSTAPNWETVKDQIIPKSRAVAGKVTMRKIPVEIENAAHTDFVAGMTPQEIEAKYELTSGYLMSSLARRFPSKGAMREALSNATLANALACSEHAALNLGEMTAVQAVGAVKILTETHLRIEEFVKEQPKTVDFEKINRIGDVLSNLEKFAGVEES